MGMLKPALQTMKKEASLPSRVKNTCPIGTVEQPTMDGGIIQPPLLPKKNSAFISAASTTERSSQAASSVAFFSDDWATDKQVKAVLTKAAKAGKLDYVLKKSEAMGLPASVAIVPMVESRYQVDALSPKGAAGAWQLMPGVAKTYGIQDAERFQFIPATNTALSLLRALHQRFGNWVLAFAAYNAGSARLHHALIQNPRARTLDALDLPIETKAYVHNIQVFNTLLMAMAHATF